MLSNYHHQLTFRLSTFNKIRGFNILTFNIADQTQYYSKLHTTLDIKCTIIIKYTIDGYDINTSFSLVIS